MHSPDRRYWWTGSQWQLAVSSDGMWWFDGQRWVPNPLGRPRRRRVPTEWTRPLQAAVIVLLVLSLVSFAVTVPFVASIPLPETVAPPGAPPEYAATVAESFRAFLVTSVVVEGIVFLGWGVLTVIGTLMRWTWMFWVTLVLLGLSIFMSAIGLLMGALVSAGIIPTSPPPGFTMPPRPPLFITAIEPALDLLRVALFVGMLVLGIRIGPWAGREVVDEW